VKGPGLWNQLDDVPWQRIHSAAPRLLPWMVAGPASPHNRLN